MSINLAAFVFFFYASAGSLNDASLTAFKLLVKTRSFRNSETKH